MTSRKLAKAFKNARISLPNIKEHILKNINQFDAVNSMTIKQLTALITVHNLAYHQGRKSTKAECLDGDLNDGLYWLGDDTGMSIKVVNRKIVE